MATKKLQKRHKKDLEAIMDSEAQTIKRQANEESVERAKKEFNTRKNEGLN